MQLKSTHWNTTFKAFGDPYAVKMCWEKASLFCWKSCREYLVSTTCIFGNSYIMGKMEKPSVKVDKFLLISCQFDSLKPFCTAASSSWYAFGRLAGSALCLRGNTHNGRLLTQLAWSLTATYQTKNTNYNFELIQIDNVFPATHSSWAKCKWFWERGESCLFLVPPNMKCSSRGIK